LLSVGFSVLSFYVLESNLWTGTALLLVFISVIFFTERNEIKRILHRDRS